MVDGNPGTEHFSDGEWLDLVRGVLPEAERDVMEHHLCTGCEDCLESYSVWARLAAFVEEERGAQVPEWAVRLARTYIAGPALAPPPGWITTIAATLTFDTRCALPAGVRAAQTGIRHLLYAAGPYAVDLYVESRARTDQIVLTGQVARTQQPDQPPRHVEVRLSDGVRQFAPAPANRFGEFQCEFARQPHLVLIVSVDETRHIEIPLETLLEPAGGPADGQ